MPWPPLTPRCSWLGESAWRWPPPPGGAGKRWVQVAFLAFPLALFATFLGLMFGLNRVHDASLPGLQAYWADSFPPRTGPLALARWLVEVHTGSMFAYPGGGRRGASAPTLILFVLGAWALWRSRQRTLLTLCLAPFALTLTAAALRRYPYGGEARITQFLAPGICLLAGLGAARVLAWIPRDSTRRRATLAAMVLLAISGIGPLVASTAHPYRMPHDVRARDFARRFWPTIGIDAEIACVRQDFGVRGAGAPDPRTSVYLCNQMIYSPQRRSRPRTANGPKWDRLADNHPLRCVMPQETPPESPEALHWLGVMTDRFTLARRETLDVDMDFPGAPLRRERVTLFEFVPKAPDLARTAGNRETPR